MHIRIVSPIVTVAFCALALAACSGKTAPTADSPGPSASPLTSSAIVVNSPSIPAAGEKPTREFVVGKWGTDGDCALAMDLRADGTSDGPYGNWSYRDGVIRFATEPDFEVHVTVIDATTMESTSDGVSAKMTRCP